MHIEEIHLRKLTAFFLLFAIILIFGFIGKTFTGYIVHDEKTIIYFPMQDDFPNAEQGKLVIGVRFPEEGFKIGTDQADYIMLADSKKVPGLKILYAQKEHRIYAGMPTIDAPIVLFDGTLHEISYFFNKKEKKQGIAVDGRVLSEGEFTGTAEGILTGYSALSLKTYPINSPFSRKFS